MSDSYTDDSSEGLENPPQETENSHYAAAAGSEGRLSALEEQVGELKNQLLRALAETENTRRRAQKEREDTAKYAVGNFAKSLVGVSDNLRRALDSIPPDTVQESEAIRTLIIGIEGIERQINSAFDQAGIKKIEPVGEMFDPNFHQVMFEVDNTGKPPGTIIQVLQAGYIIHDRLLREAIVGVAKGEPGERKVDTMA